MALVALSDFAVPVAPGWLQSRETGPAVYPWLPFVLNLPTAEGDLEQRFMSDRCISRSGRRRGACGGDGGGAGEIKETPEMRLSGREVLGEQSFTEEGRGSF